MVKSLFLSEGEFNSLYAIWGLHYIAKVVDAMGFGPILGISPVRLPQTPCLFGFMHPLKLVEVSHKATRNINGGHVR